MAAPARIMLSLQPVLISEIFFTDTPLSTKQHEPFCGSKIGNSSETAKR